MLDINIISPVSAYWQHVVNIAFVLNHKPLNKTHYTKLK